MFGCLLSTNIIHLPLENEKTVLDLKHKIDSSDIFTLLDVRDAAQISICKIESALSLPLRQILHAPALAAKTLRRISPVAPIFVVCRRGLDSRIATTELLKLGFPNVYDVAGGLDAWRRHVDPYFPDY